MDELFGGTNKLNSIYNALCMIIDQLGNTKTAKRVEVVIPSIIHDVRLQKNLKELEEKDFLGLDASTNYTFSILEDFPVKQKGYVPENIILYRSYTRFYKDEDSRIYAVYYKVLD